VHGLLHISWPSQARAAVAAGEILHQRRREALLTQRCNCDMPVAAPLLDALKKPGASAALFSPVGTGKTHVAAYVAARLEEEGVIDRIWVCAPKPYICSNMINLLEEEYHLPCRCVTYMCMRSVHAHLHVVVARRSPRAVGLRR
jgi:hypothetical protein